MARRARRLRPVPGGRPGRAPAPDEVRTSRVARHRLADRRSGRASRERTDPHGWSAWPSGRRRHLRRGRAGGRAAIGGRRRCAFGQTAYVLALPVTAPRNWPPAWRTSAGRRPPTAPSSSSFAARRSTPAGFSRRAGSTWPSASSETCGGPRPSTSTPDGSPHPDAQLTLINVRDRPPGRRVGIPDQPGWRSAVRRPRSERGDAAGRRSAPHRGSAHRGDGQTPSGLRQVRGAIRAGRPALRQPGRGPNPQPPRPQRPGAEPGPHPAGRSDRGAKRCRPRNPAESGSPGGLEYLGYSVAGSSGAA